MSQEPDPQASRHLVTRVQQGDRAAIDALLAYHLPRLHSWLRVRIGGGLGPRESTSDVVQSACREVLENLDRFHYEGEAGFRALEAAVLNQIASWHSLVVATGGGVVTRPENWGQLHQGVVIWLDAPEALLLERLRSDATPRPLLQTADPAARHPDGGPPRLGAEGLLRTGTGAGEPGDDQDDRAQQEHGRQTHDDEPDPDAGDGLGDPDDSWS